MGYMPHTFKILLKLIPEKRIGQAEDIGKAAVLLASDDADYVNGTTLFVDGGTLTFDIRVLKIIG